MRDWADAVRAHLHSAALDPRSEEAVVAELSEHLEDLYRELSASGLPDDECRRRVLAELEDSDRNWGARLRRRSDQVVPLAPVGGPLAGAGPVATLIFDVRAAARSLRAQPVFSLIVIGMLAVGLAGNAAIFSIVNGLVLRPLPFAESGRLVELDETAPQWNLRYVGVSVPDFVAWRAGNGTFDRMAFFTGASYNLAADGAHAQRVSGVQVTHDMLDVLGLKPLLGRDFTTEDDRPGSNGVVMLTDDLWRHTFGGDPGVLGRVVKLDERPYTVIGVLPASAVFPDRADLWTPLAADLDKPSGYYLNGVGRLLRGVSIERSQADLLRVHKALIADGRSVNRITSPVVIGLRDRYLGDFKTVSRVLAGAVALVLVIACVNVAALMMVRGLARAREITIRTALGASPHRLAAQLFTESFVLAAVAAACGVPLGLAALRAIVARLPDGVPRWVSFSLDVRFVIFCISVTAGATLVSSVAPVLQALRTDLRGALQGVATRTTATRAQRSVFGALVICETGLALILVAGAGLLMEAWRSVLSIDPGFRADHVMTFGLALPDATYGTAEKRITYYNELLSRLRRMPGLQAVGATSAPPLGGHWGGQFEAEGAPVDSKGGDNPVVLRVAATTGYFDAIGATLLAGRAFESRDELTDAPPVAIINETLSKHFWGTSTPIGRRIRYPGSRDWFQVIGLLRDEKHDGLDRDATPTVFLPYATAIRHADSSDLRSLRLMTLVLRSTTEPSLLVGPARDIVGQLDPDLPMYGVQSMTERVDRSLSVRRLYSALFGIFATVAILLAAAGVYGTVSFAVSQRMPEIGIRLAIGARPVQVLTQTLFAGMTLVSIGIVVGLFGASWATTLLGTLLYRVSARDPVIYAAAAVGMLVVGVLANLVPSYRAASVDPICTLRSP